MTALRLILDNPDAPRPSLAGGAIRRLKFMAAAAHRFANEGEDPIKRSTFAELERKILVAIEMLETRQAEAS